MCFLILFFFSPSHLRPCTSYIKAWNCDFYFRRRENKDSSSEGHAAHPF